MVPKISFFTARLIITSCYFIPLYLLKFSLTHTGNPGHKRLQNLWKLPGCSFFYAYILQQYRVGVRHLERQHFLKYCLFGPSATECSYSLRLGTWLWFPTSNITNYFLKTVCKLLQPKANVANIPLIIE